MDKVLIALENKDISIPNDYLKVFKSYLSYKNKYANDNHTKSLIRNKMKKLQAQKRVSSYRIYKDLRLNAGNFHAFLNNGNLDRLSLANARNALNYLEQTNYIN